MTDKELRKLSRLELLELLLEASKENKMLKEEISRLEVDNKTSQNIETLSVMTRQMESSIRYVSGLADVLRGASGDSVNADRPRHDSGSLADVDIYKRLLIFFATNEDKIDVLPADIGDDVRARIKSLLEKRKPE